MKNTQLPFSNKVLLISLFIFHCESYCAHVASGSVAREKEMLERKRGRRERGKYSRYMWVVHYCQQKIFAKKQVDL